MNESINEWEFATEPIREGHTKLMETDVTAHTCEG